MNNFDAKRKWLLHCENEMNDDVDLFLVKSFLLNYFGNCVWLIYTFVKCGIIYEEAKIIESLFPSIITISRKTVERFIPEIIYHGCDDEENHSLNYQRMHLGWNQNYIQISKISQVGLSLYIDNIAIFQEIYRSSTKKKTQSFFKESHYYL